jgi:hypothetical protein
MPEIIPLYPKDAAISLPQPIVLLAERLYTRMGYLRVRVIPQFARSSRGTLDATVIFYRALSA